MNSLKIIVLKLIYSTQVYFLKGHPSRKNFYSVFPQKILTDVKTNFTKFELSTTFCSQEMTIWISPSKFRQGCQL